MGTIAEKLRAALDSKNAIKTVLEEKNLYPTNEFSTYSGLVSELENTSDATATSESILEGETAYTAEGKVTGTAVAGIPVVTTEGDGSAYTATVSNVKELTVGMKITIIPHETSTSVAPTLNVNDLGEKYIRQRLSTTTATTVAGKTEAWLVANKPITVMYDGTYWIAELTRPDANTFYGTLDVDQGGTGATTAEEALENLGAVGKADIVDNLESESTEAPLSANQGRVLNEKVEEVKTAFQDGCDTIVAGCTTYGSTPESNSPADIVDAIKAIYNSRYSSGYDVGQHTFDKTSGVGSGHQGFIDGTEGGSYAHEYTTTAKSRVVIVGHYKCTYNYYQDTSYTGANGFSFSGVSTSFQKVYEDKSTNIYDGSRYMNCVRWFIAIGSFNSGKNLKLSIDTKDYEYGKYLYTAMFTL